MRAAFLAHNAQGRDALGTQLTAKVRFARDQGWDFRVFVESDLFLAEDLKHVCQVVDLQGLWGNVEQRRFLQAADLVFAEYGHHYELLNVLPVLRQQVGRRPVIVFSYYGVTPATFWPKHQRRRFEEAQRHRVLAWCADHVLVPSRFAAAELQQATGIPRQRITMLPCFVPAAVQATSGAEASNEIRRQFGIGNAFVILHVGRLAPNKRLPVIIKAVARLGDLGRPVHLVALGSNTDIYAEEARRCQRVAEEHGVSSRFHVLGQVSDDVLAAWYRSADVLVSASRHESFCLPLIEAMANGLAVVAARAAALPETVGEAGLTFRPDDADDLARQLRRLLDPGGRSLKLSIPSTLEMLTPHPQPRVQPRLPDTDRLAIVTPRYGTDFVGGAETSLRTIAHALSRRGFKVEVFTTCNRHDWNWANHLPAGTTRDGPLLVHRFPIDPHDRDRHLASLEPFQVKGRLAAPPEAEANYLHHSLNSTALVATLAERRHDFRAVLAGPYLFGLTWSAARRLHRQLLLVPCFHDEPFARMELLLEVYRQVGGVLYHSPEEQQLAQAELGFHHPCSAVIGACLDVERVAGDAAQGRRRCGEAYVVYCGRYSEEKGVNLLLGWAERYNRERPGRPLRVVFLGQGQPLPAAPWVLNLGFVEQQLKCDVLAGARALVQLSLRESLSLVILEAWAAGTPVIGHRDCNPVRAQIERSGGGWTVGDYEEFARVLDRLLDRPTEAAARGQAGRQYVQTVCASPDNYADRIVRTIAMMDQPLGEVAREQGLRRAAAFSAAAWAARFADFIAAASASPSGESPVLHVTPACRRRRVPVSEPRMLVPVKIANRGNILAAAAGPGSVFIQPRLWAETDQEETPPSPATPLPTPLAPGQTRVALVAVSLPRRPGAYRLTFELVGAQAAPQADANAAAMEVLIGSHPGGRVDIPEPFLEHAQSALTEAHRLKDLPTTYEDVTEGSFKSIKRFIKSRLLNNFRRAYVDVLSRQQSAFNQAVLAALSQLAEACAALGQAVPGDTLGEVQENLLAHLRRLTRSHRRLRKQVRALARRLGACALPTGDTRRLSTKPNKESDNP